MCVRGTCVVRAPYCRFFATHTFVMAAPTLPLPTPRSALIARLEKTSSCDIVVVGGGATGLGVALDAAARGWKVVLVEANDFAKGSSSRATKLLHGGVRYLAQGNFSLVYEALHERTTLLKNAAHLAQALPFVIPTYRWWEKPLYGLGLTLYDVLAGSAGLGKTKFLNPKETLALLARVVPSQLRGGVKYWDAQFDDARLALALARTAAQHDALLLNYCKATQLSFENGKVTGVLCTDALTAKTYRVRAPCVVNATGVWVDALRELDANANRDDEHPPPPSMVAPSQGVHIVVDAKFLGGACALVVPKTSDGRVLFAVPWLGKLILGTTDTARHDLPLEPQASRKEIDFILREAARYLHPAPRYADIKSIWVGLRPLVKSQDFAGERTQAMSREHTILVSPSSLVTVTGGKWTTYRSMAEDVLQECVEHALLPQRPPGTTSHLKLVGAQTPEAPKHSLALAPGFHLYGSEQAAVRALPGTDQVLCAGLTESMVRFAARYEYAITVEDMLARRSRLLFLDAFMASTLAHRVGTILQEETGLDPQVESFLALAQHYLAVPL